MRYEAIPPKGIRDSALSPTEIDKDIPRSGHFVSLVTKQYAHKPNKHPTLWYKKTYSEGQQELAELEAAIAEVYRLILGRWAPKVRAVYDEDNEIVGSISKSLEDFVPLVDYKGRLEELLDHGLTEILVASYFNAEDDAHKRNLGKDGRIDFDMSCWPVTSKRKGERYYSYYFAKKFPNKHMGLSARDIRNFPVNKDCWAFYWPTNLIFVASSVNSWLKDMTPQQLFNVKSFVKEEMYTEEDKAHFTMLAEDPRFIEKKFHTFLRILLIPPQQFTHIARAYLRDPETQQEFIQFYADRQDKLLKLLLNMDQFHEYLQKHGESALAEILYEFGEYSATFKNITRDKTLLINPKTITTRYTLIWRDSHQQYLAWQLLHLSDFIKKLEKTHHRDAYLALHGLYESLQEKAVGNAKTTGFFNRNDIELMDVALYGNLAIQEIMKEKRIIETYLPVSYQEHWHLISTSLVDTYQSMAGDAGRHLLEAHAARATTSASTTPLYRLAAHTEDYYDMSPQKSVRLLENAQNHFYSWLTDPNNLETLRQIIIDACNDYLRDEHEGSAPHQPSLGSGATFSSGSSESSSDDAGALSLNHLFYWGLKAATKTASVFDYTMLTRRRRVAVETLKNSCTLMPQTQLIEKLLEMLKTGSWKKNSFNTRVMKHFFAAFSADFKMQLPIHQRVISPSLFRFYDYQEKSVIMTDGLMETVYQCIDNAHKQMIKKQAYPMARVK